MKRALAWLALCCALPAHAIDRIRLRTASVSAADIRLEDVDVTLQIRSAENSAIELRAARLTMPQALESQSGALTDLHLQCTDPVIREPVFDCPGFSMQATSTRWPDLHAEGKGGYRSDTGAYMAEGTGLQIAGRPVQFSITGDAAGTEALLTLRSMEAAKVKEFLVAQKLPIADLTYSGQGDVDARIIRRADATTAEFTLALRDAGYQSSDYTLIGEKLAFTASGTIGLTQTPMPFEMRISGSNGQALAGPVLLDFGKNPLQMTLDGNYSTQGLHIASFRSEQRDLATVTGSAELGLAPLVVREAAIDAIDVRFPAAYAGFLQIALATTPFNQLAVTGGAELHAILRDNQPVKLDVAVSDLAFSDASRELKVDGVRSEVHWAADLDGPPRPSWLSWNSSRGWGIVGASARLDFIVQDRDIRLIQPARLPFFDGALRINALVAEHIGTGMMNGVFDAVVEPISVAPIAKAMGLPEFAGKLAGTIPGLTYKDRVLSLQGNLEADVFDGKLVASNLRIRDPLGAWPRLYGDVIARNLDLGQLTSAFEFGNITGRLDIEITGIETFNWSPVALDLRLATPEGDRTQHRISQRAVQNLADISGGGLGVTAALQSPFLRFFDDFSYDRIGLSCRLRNNVCQMSGAGTSENGGYYIVRGSGLPRLDIIGNTPLVDWPQFLSQVLNAIRNPTDIEVK